MKKKTKYTNEKIGKIKIVDDFLPPPEDLVSKEEMVKITIMLNKECVDFFKNIAKENHTSYQRMIKNLLDRYTKNYSRAS
ncbi:MAG: CopG family transcriptional regulator [Oligoflexia bacterium]|nr:CopG family transcriptional regulator [Oligoflexia bacterium]MBF0363729.1 CopG family transcriptional regulator [Oligoflexia bacterium]